MQCIAPRFLGLDPSLDLPLNILCCHGAVLQLCKLLRGDMYLMRCVPSKYSKVTWLSLCMPCITWGCWQALGEWQIGSLRKCEQREGPSSIIGSDTRQGARRSSLKSCFATITVTVATLVTAGAWLHQLVSASVQPTH